jgi:hypothetical protein
MQLSGFVLNRSLAFDVGKRLPDEEAFAAAHVPPSARPKVLEMAEREKQTCDGHTQLLDSLRDRLGDSAHTFAVALPFLPDGVADIHSLNALIPTL